MPKLNKYITVLCLAVTAALFASGCTSTRTQEDPSQYMTSTSITNRVKWDLMNDPGIHSFISVTTFKSVVELSGFVGSYQEKQRAVAVARNVPGVKAVKDGLVVKQGK